MNTIHKLLIKLFEYRTNRIYTIKKPDTNLKGATLPVTGNSDVWGEKANLPSFRYEFNGGLVDDEIIIVGGIYLPTVYTVTRLVEAYNIKTNSWRKLKKFPKIIHHPGVVSCDNELYVVGGNGLRIWPYKSLYKYKSKENLWKKLPDMFTPRGALGVTECDGKIYVVGGGAQHVPLDNNEAFNPTTNTWEILAPMPTKREHLCCASACGYVFAFGGYEYDLTKPLDINEMYDPKTNTWVKKAPMPRPMCGMNSVGIGESVYVFGGEQGFALSAEVWEYKVKEDKWYRHKDMPSKRYSHALVYDDDVIHVIGGNLKLYSELISTEHFTVKLYPA